MLKINWELFDAKVTRHRGKCWEWSAGCHVFGYGVFGVNKNGENVTETAHRISWLRYRGPIPRGKCVLHTCDNPPCTNPDHLYIGNRADNMRDCLARGRARGGGPKGEDHHKAKLTTKNVREIRKRRRAGEAGSILAQEFGVTPTTICYIVKRKTWKHVR